ncbi:Holliday junction branch migration DNA helicase RuvB [Candidatus Roizmanbacteria bacterium CG_4_9_14_0_2_um_filter_39_13]|uniref:Holliday junction branch migration complex subunit RuvB n=2 Tax=Candidatus Roizmaniibacteriota TaxID=1752723 RepID=A0A2M8EX95_9BACT|nr:MAG: Holliday junction branch migration DNA helicase RuvB [Candidatus Roizmanbacteria bacterium CG_4_10_14_0_2_um_filter_39_13]PJC30469.1 MAG: Holliday junction branch migration DNA helicase RuvB [Candidatus Roizmanbacteria bacterium CG_4_9_14_0_2_um_filter_39_13]
MSNDAIDLQKLRPDTLDTYVGQRNVVKTLNLFLKAVKNRGVATEHILFYGPPGIGKTTLSYIIAKELKGTIRVTSGAAITKSGDLAAILTNLKDKDVLFIDEIHRLPKPVEEMLYPVIEEYFLDIVIGKGPSARTVRLPVPKITIVGATTKLALLSAPLRDRFGLLLRLDYYTDFEMEHIINRSANIMGIKITEVAVRKIAERSRKTPRIANRILKRARDMFEVDNHEVIDENLIDSLFKLLEIDAVGLSDLDIQYLRAIAEKFQNSPVGVETLASALSEDRRTIEEFIEPYLLRIGFIKKTPRGRVVTPKGCKHLNIKQDRVDQQALI